MTKNTNLSLRLNFEMEEAPCENPIHASAQTRTARSSEISRALYGTGITGLSFFFLFSINELHMLTNVLTMPELTDC